MTQVGLDGVKKIEVWDFLENGSDSETSNWNFVLHIIIFPEYLSQKITSFNVS